MKDGLMVLSIDALIIIIVIGIIANIITGVKILIKLFGKVKIRRRYIKRRRNIYK